MSKYFIDRNKAVNALNEAQIEGTDTYKGLGLAKQIIDTLPCECRPKGEWKRMSDLPEDKDDRYECSRCGNVLHYKKRIDLYTFNSWCGRCGSLNNPSRYER